MAAEALFEINQKLVLGICSCLSVLDGRSLGLSTTVAQNQGRESRKTKLPKGAQLHRYFSACANQEHLSQHLNPAITAF